MPPYFQGRTWQEIRLDVNPEVLPDVVAPILDMTPVENASVDAVYSPRNITYLHPREVPVVLQEFRRVLKPDGFLALTCPDLQAICALVAEDKLDEPAYLSPKGSVTPLDMLYGNQEVITGGDLHMIHKSGFTARTLETTLIESGYKSCEIRRGKNFDLMVLAYPTVPTDERIKSDMKACWPAET